MFFSMIQQHVANIPWYWALAAAVVVAVAGSLFHAFEIGASRWRFVGEMGLAGIVALIAFSLLWNWVDDPLQSIAVSGGAGILGGIAVKNIVRLWSQIR